jgi:hypothetical protein
LLLPFVTVTSPSAPVTLDFEDLEDSTVIGATYADEGKTFQGGLAVKAGFTLFEQEFPPHSGTVAVLDDFMPVELTFTTPVGFFLAFFTYTVPLQLTAFSSSNVLVASVSSGSSNNTALSGEPGTAPNEELQLSSAAGISRIVITGDLAGNSFVMDDITFNAAVVVPEPGTIVCVLAVLPLLSASVGRVAGKRGRK